MYITKTIDMSSYFNLLFKMCQKYSVVNDFIYTGCPKKDPIYYSFLLLMLKKENLNLKFFPLKKIYFAPEEFQNFKLQKAVINICITRPAQTAAI